MTGNAVTLQDAQACWPADFAAVAAELRAVWSAPCPEVLHIGSTSVPGLCAKPVLDVLMGVRALDDATAHSPALARLGYRYRPEYEAELPERRYFVRPEGPGRLRVHLHAVLPGGALWRAHLVFRDALRADPALAAAYATLKRELAQRHADDKAAYTAAKGPFIQRVLAAAG